MREKDDLMRSVLGVGPELSLTPLAYLPKLGTLNRKQIAALGLGRCGALQLGRWSILGQALCPGDRATVRSTLYMGAWVAIRFNPVLHAFYLRLLEVGRPKKVPPCRVYTETVDHPQRHDKDRSLLGPASLKPRH